MTKKCLKCNEELEKVCLFLAMSDGRMMSADYECLECGDLYTEELLTNN